MPPKKKIKVAPCSEITPYIYIGTNAFRHDPLQRKLLDLGIKANISLEAERLDVSYGAAFFLWLPTVDFTAPSPKQLELGVKTIDFLVKNKIKVFVHCKKGQGRSPTLVAAYFISKGLSAAAAIRKIKKKRPEIIIGREQRQALTAFAKKSLAKNARKKKA